MTRGRGHPDQCAAPAGCLRDRAPVQLPRLRGLRPLDVHFAAEQAGNPVERTTPKETRHRGRKIYVTKEFDADRRGAPSHSVMPR